MQYAALSKRFGHVPMLEMPELGRTNKEHLLRYDELKAEVETSLTEYWGLVGSNDRVFTSIITEYRKCKIPSIRLVDIIKNREDAEKFDPPTYLENFTIEQQKVAGSFYDVCQKITVHLRFVIAPV
jgi:hypothetical protein